MPDCHHCGTTLLKGAKYCHECGAKVAPQELHITCAQCGTDNPATARYCVQCGHALQSAVEEQLPAPAARYGSRDQERKLVHTAFNAILRDKVNTYFRGDKELYDRYLTRYYETDDFRQLLELRAQQMVQVLLEEGRVIDSSTVRDEYGRELEQLVHTFLFKYARSLNPIDIPEAVLKYQTQSWEEVDLERMALDYLQLDEEPLEVIYPGDMIAPDERTARRMRNAYKSWLSIQLDNPDDRLFFVVDLTLRQSLKEGFAMTDRGLWWKAPFNKQQTALFLPLRDVKRVNDWITINGSYFHVSKSINLKMLLFLKQIIRMLERR